VKKQQTGYIILLMAALAFFFIKINQRGKNTNIKQRFTIGNVTEAYTQIRDTSLPIDYSNIITCEMECRQITANDVAEIMQKGELNFGSDDTYDAYPLEGKTASGKSLRVIFKIDNGKKQVLSTVDLNNIVKCNNCK
jgi:Domain of unknown function (DUF4258)